MKHLVTKEDSSDFLNWKMLVNGILCMEGGCAVITIISAVKYLLIKLVNSATV